PVGVGRPLAVDILRLIEVPRIIVLESSSQGRSGRLVGRYCGQVSSTPGADVASDRHVLWRAGRRLHSGSVIGVCRFCLEITGAILDDDARRSVENVVAERGIVGSQRLP